MEDDIVFLYHKLVPLSAFVPLLTLASADIQLRFKPLLDHVPATL